MDIAGLSVNMSFINTSSQLGIAVLNMAKSDMSQQGQALQELIAAVPESATLEQSVMPHIGGIIDVRL